MSTAPAPTTVEEYIQWAKSAIASDFVAPGTRNRYETNVQTIQNAVQESPFFRNLNAYLTEQGSEYQRKTGGELLFSKEFTILRKPFNSAVEKSFRQNVLDNRHFPDTWYGHFNDLVRGTLICKFFDGPDFLAKALEAYAAANGLKSQYSSRSNERGYYAFHHYTEFPFEIVDNLWASQTVQAQLEIQLTTQLQEVLRELTHPLYEQIRTKPLKRDESWKWEHETPRFKTSFLGHTLHMIEAVILQVRDSVHPQTQAIAVIPEAKEAVYPDAELAVPAHDAPGRTETSPEQEIK